MTDFSKVLETAKNMQNKMKETQESIKKIEAEGVAGGGSIKICLNGKKIRLFNSFTFSNFLNLLFFNFGYGLG